VSFPPSATPLTDIERVLCVFAHPDDVDFSAAGTVAHWVDAGIEVTYLLVTRGESGGFDDTPRDRIPSIREAEQRAAAAAVGVKSVYFLDGYRDGTVVPSIELRTEITAAIREHRPDRILTNSPLRRWDRIAGPSHPDHLAVGEATTCAVYPDARNEFALPELLRDRGLLPWTVREIWYAGGPSPDYGVDIGTTYDRKLAALQAHVSQTAHLPDLDALLRQRLTYMATSSGMPEGTLAEAFTVISTA
jgi:LmbE family N-acetylglucosaminyl deacetylase